MQTRELTKRLNPIRDLELTVIQMKEYLEQQLKQDDNPKLHDLKLEKWDKDLFLEKMILCISIDNLIYWVEEPDDMEWIYISLRDQAVKLFNIIKVENKTLEDRINDTKGLLVELIRLQQFVIEGDSNE